MSDGEWWRKQGPWSEPPGGAGASGAGGDGDSVYAGEPAPAVPPRPQGPPRPVAAPSGGSDAGASGGASGGPGAGGEASGAPAAFLPPPTRSGQGRGATRGADRGDGPSWLAKPVEDAPADPEALPPAYRAVSTGDWDYVTIDFGDGPAASNRPIPEQRTAADAGSAPGADEDAAPGDPAAPDAGAAGDTAEPTEGGAAGKGKRKGRARGSGKEPAGKRTGGKKAPARGKDGPAEGAPAAKGGPAKAPGGRRPSPLLLLAAAVLIGGAVTGQLIAMLIGWALGYLSRQLSDFMKKLVVFGIPLMVISGSSLFYWGRAQGRWGAAPPPGEQGSHAMWVAAPGVLRVAAVLSAVLLLLMSLRRKGGGAAGGGQ
ncbi:hypothetical protein KPATCC21470_4119 [Kitasatospora purpeofusca]